jgi:hypothetical protein
MGAVAVVGLAVVLAGCGSAADDPQVASAGGAGATTSTTAGAEPAVDDEDRMRQFAACMREHGIDLPDPQPGGGLVHIEGKPGDVDRDAMRAAMEACRSLMPNGGQPPRLSPEDLEKVRAMAACMREHGVDMPDPDPDSGGMMIPHGENAPPPPDDETLRQAMEACRHLGPDLVIGRRAGGGP